MADSQLNPAERPLQPRFSKGKAFQRLGIVALLLATLGADVYPDWPNRLPRPAAAASIRFKPLPLPEPSAGAARLEGLWALSSPDPRFGGISAAALDGGGLLALNDAGVVIRLPFPGRSRVAHVVDLPDGPGDPHWKKHRDSEALARDPWSRGWWVAFEQHHSLWLFDPQFRRTLARRDIPLRSGWRNYGIEGLVPLSDGLLLLSEAGPQVARFGPEGFRARPLAAQGRPSEAVRLRDGRVLVVERLIRPWRLRSRLSWLVRSGGGYALEPWLELPLGQYDNVEAMAAQPTNGGGTRLWLLTDDDFSASRRTLLMTLTVPAARAGPR